MRMTRLILGVFEVFGGLLYGQGQWRLAEKFLLSPAAIMGLVERNAGDTISSIPEQLPFHGDRRLSTQIRCRQGW